MSLINKKNVFPYLLKFNSNNFDKYLLLIKQKQREFKKTEAYLNETMAENQEQERQKVHVMTHFQNFC